MSAVEIGFDQRLDVTDDIRRRRLSRLSSARDLAGNDRVLVFASRSGARCHACEAPRKYRLAIVGECG